MVLIRSTLIVLLSIQLWPFNCGQRVFFPGQMDRMKNQNQAPFNQPPLAAVSNNLQSNFANNQQRPTNFAPARPALPLSTATAGGQQQQHVDAETSRIISRGVTSVMLALNREVSGVGRSAVVFSPLSISEALAVVLLGSSGNTFRELATFLGFIGPNDAAGNQRQTNVLHREFGQLLKVLNKAGTTNHASGIFVQDGIQIRPQYKKAATAVYDSEVINLDFAREGARAQSFINNWVADRTNYKIQNILASPPPAETRVIIMSALYFRAAWEQPFFEEATQRRPFFPNGRNDKSNQVMVDMMANGGDFLYYKDLQLGCEIIALPYQGNETAMYIILPLDSTPENLRLLEQNLTPESVQYLLDNLRLKEIVFLVPKMRLETSFSLRAPLMRQGVRSLFDARAADLSLITQNAFDPKNTGSTQNQNPTNQQVAPMIFSRFGETNCAELFESNSILANCTDELPEPINNKTKVVYKRFGDKIGRRFARHSFRGRRQTQRPNGGFQENEINGNGGSNGNGLYADDVVHKVFIDITETGTEAAAATSVSLSRNGGRPVINVNAPFLFLIRHRPTNLDLFWGSVLTPTPSYR